MLPWLKRKNRIRVAIIGDIILDEYLNGTVSRISPEAPVPVHLVKGTSYSAGGSANAARNISLVGAEAFLFGICGDDEAANILLNLLKNDGVDTSSIIRVHNRPTNKKTRVTSSNQQIVRIDWEKVHALEQENQDMLLSHLEAKNVDVILVSDYGKGLLPKELLANIFKVAKKRNIPCVVDPKGADFSRYQGCTVITPNLRESYFALGLEEENQTGESLGRRLQEKFALNDVLVTMGPYGMIYVPKAKEEIAIYKKAQAKEVYDVSGAGDTVAAILALGLASQAPREEVLSCANQAAAIVVGKWGTQAVTQEELTRALQQHDVSSESLEKKSHKIIYSDNLHDFQSKIKGSGLKVVFTNGCFDLLHVGHIDYLEKARQLGDILVVGINTDESIQELKGKSRPIIELANRMRILAAMSCVDYVIPFSEQTPLRLIQELSPHILVKGADYNEASIVGAEYVRSLGGEVQTIDLVPGVSSSGIIKKIQTLPKT